MALLLVLAAGLLASLSNYTLRRSLDMGGTPRAFLVIQMSIAFVVALLLGPVRSGGGDFDWPMATLGLVGGLCLSYMLLVLGKALQQGPPGFTFSILNASTLMPALIMAILFGAANGYVYNYTHALGSLLVLAGLFWAGKGVMGVQNRNLWLVFSLVMFCLHVLFLLILQLRALLINTAHPEQILPFFNAETVQSQWFMPMVYCAAALFQLTLFLSSERRLPQQGEFLNGCWGGAANSLCTFLLIWATEIATPLENAVVFPVFSVVTVVISNAWGQKLYQERVNWKACQLCIAGLFIGTVNWTKVLAIFAGSA
jgi:hypothetical protein